MDFTKTGLFIAELRHAKGWTQTQLAQQLGVTDKAVSRWETGRGFPDVGILLPLAATLDISVIELINGERAKAEIPAQQADAAVLDALLQTRRTIRKMAGLLLLLFGVGMILFRFFYIAGDMGASVSVLGIGAVAVGVLLMLVKQEPSQGRRRAKLPGFACCAVWIALLLELLPNSVRMAFGLGPGKLAFQDVSYLSLLSYGYGNVFPFLTVFLSFGIAFLLTLLCLRGKPMPRLRNTAFFCTLACVALAALAAFFGGYPTPAGIAAFVLIAASAVMQYLGNYRNL